MRLRTSLAATTTLAVLLGACSPADDQAEDAADEPAGTASEDSGKDGATPFTFGSGTDEQATEGAGPMVVITDVRMGSHEGFDRLVFEIGGEGDAGWHLAYTDDPRTQGKGEEVDIEGEAVLAAAVTNIAMPTDEEAMPEGIEPWDGPERLDGPEDGHIAELVEDTVFEGRHLFHVGLDGEVPYTVQRLDDPQRVVIDFLVEQT
ncbi:hypothetical protein [Haloechinothrix sp. LS1_15]|uniref:AMIN-like domain-containing (lipo)protein n=1 Tax=Haloechinothrix sp. LS1_15 TaxID=2652248 RepID=UPI0029466E84|nr:hypothetical protein [Haloechinothrix sp. LS1_15]MDV6012423.1 hypothetical protein [Haloechinothrix sp. LS1_15]